MNRLIKLYCAISSLKPIRNERGVTALEYALIAAAVAVVIGVAFTAFFGGIGTLLTNICDTLGVSCGPAESV